MTKLYEDLKRIINFEPDKDEEAQMEKYFKNRKKSGAFGIHFCH